MKNCTRAKRGTGVRAMFASATLCAIALASCGPGIILFPLYSKGGTVMDDNLAGSWEFSSDEDKPQKDCCWTFAKEGDHYIVHLPDADDHEDWVMKAHLVKLGGAVFLDVEAGDVKYSQTTQLSFPVIDVHMIGRVWINKDTAQIAMLDDAWVRDHGANATPPLRVVVRDDDIFVTSSTTELQAFATKNADNKDAFSEKYFLKRHAGN